MLACKTPASVILKNQLIRSISISLHNSNQCMPMPDYGPVEMMSSELMNGIKIASAKPFGFQYGACTIMYQAGPRYEVDDQIGASHFIRAMSPGSGSGYSAFIKSRYLQQHGGVLSCSADRQSIAFTLCCPVTSFDKLNGYLLDTAARCCYHPWEIDDCRSTVKDDLVRITPEQMVMDLIQKASFSGPLSNSVFCPEERIDSVSREDLLAFVKDNFKSVRCSIGSVGVPFEETVKMAEKIDSKREKPPDPPVLPSHPKDGYEYHDLGADSETWIAVAVPGCSSRDISSLLKHNIVASACGVGAVQRGGHAGDRTPHPPLGAMATDQYTDYAAFNISYFDRGIFELSLARHDEHCGRFAEGLALQAAAGTLPVITTRHVAALLDAAPPEDVVTTARALAANSKGYLVHHEFYNDKPTEERKMRVWTVRRQVLDSRWIPDIVGIIIEMLPTLKNSHYEGKAFYQNEK